MKKHIDRINRNLLIAAGAMVIALVSDIIVNDGHLTIPPMEVLLRIIINSYLVSWIVEKIEIRIIENK